MSGMRASAATLCVNQNPKSGCPYTTIGAAVAAAASGDTINVAPGRYAEDVHITQPVSLIGAGAQWTIINAKGLSNGIFIDGINGEGTWDRLAASAKQEYRDNAQTLLGQINEQRQPFTRKDAEAILLPTLFIAGEKNPWRPSRGPACARRRHPCGHVRGQTNIITLD